jgi:Tol biopolymer transport system component
VESATWRIAKSGLGFEKYANDADHEQRAHSIATVSPDGKSVAYALENGIGQSLWVRDLTTNRDLQIIEPDTVNFSAIAFSPDGKYLYFPRSERLNPVFGYMCRISAHGGAVEQLIRDADSTPSFSPDQKHFVYTRGYPPRNLTDVRIANVDGSDDHVLKTLEGHQVFDGGATWSPDGTTIAVSIQKFGEGRFVLYEIAASDGKTEEVYSSARSIGRPVWTDNGKSLLMTLEDERTRRGQIWMMSSRGGEARRLTNDLSDYSSAISVSSDRRTVLAITNGTNSDLWWADAKDLSALHQATTKGSVFGVRSLADGRLLTFGDGIFVSNTDGSNSVRISDLRNLDSVESCGSYAIAQAHSGTNWSLQRVGLALSPPTALVSGDSLPCLFAGWKIPLLHELRSSGADSSGRDGRGYIVNPCSGTRRHLLRDDNGFA